MHLLQRYYQSLASLKKCTCQVLWKKMVQNNCPKAENAECSFRHGCRSTDQIFTRQQIFEKLCQIAFLTSRKQTTGFLEKSFGECCGSTVLMTVCYWSSCHCISAQTFASMLAESNHNHTVLVFHFDKGVCCRCSSSMPRVTNVVPVGTRLPARTM